MAVNKYTIAALLMTSGTLYAQFDAPANPLALGNSTEKQQNRTLTAVTSYNPLSHAGMPVGLLDQKQYPLSFELGVKTQKLASENDSVLSKNLAVTAPRVTAGVPGKTVFTAGYGVIPLTKKISSERTLSMPQHRFGFALAAQNPAGSFRFGLNLDGFAGTSTYKETGDSGRAVLGADNIGISFGTHPHKLFTMDAGFFVSGYVDTLFGTPTYKDPEGNDKMVRQERIAEIELPRITTCFTVGDTSVPVISTFGFTYGKKHFVHAVRDLANQPSYGADLSDPQYPNVDAIITDSVQFHLKNRLHLVPSEGKAEITPAVEIGYFHNGKTRMKPGEDNKPFQYAGEHTGHGWENSSFRFGVGADMLFINCINPWIEYGRSSAKLELTGEAYTQEDHKEGFNRFAAGTELAVHRISGVSLPKNGEFFADLGFLAQEESGMFGYYGSEQYKHFFDIKTNTQIGKYQPWTSADNRVKTTDFNMGLRGSFRSRLIELGGRIHFVKQTMTDTDSELPVVGGPKASLTFTYNMTDKKK